MGTTKTLRDLTQEDYLGICEGFPYTQLVSSVLHKHTLHTVLSGQLPLDEAALFYARLYKTLTGTDLCIVKSGGDYNLVHGNGHLQQRTEFEIVPISKFSIPFTHSNHYELRLVAHLSNHGRLEVIEPLVVETSA
jgi:hypothetical protein